MSNNRLFIIPSGGGGLDPTNYYTKSEVNTLIADFITASTDDLINYYLTSETYTQTEVNNLIAAIDQFHYEIYESTSAITDPQSNVLYLIGPSATASGDLYEEYIYANNEFVKIGDTSIDLSDYVTSTELATTLNDYVTSTGLANALADYTPTVNLSTVATSGSYLDLSDTPVLSTVATSGNYNDLTNKPDIPVVPTLATVATSGSYDDLTDKPSIPVVPTLATVATTGSYNDLTDKLTAGERITISSSNVISAEGAVIVELTQAQYDVLGTKDPDAIYVITDAPSVDMDDYVTVSSISTVALTGSYNDLTDKPSITDVSGVNDGTNWTSITIGTTTAAIPSGGGGVTQQQSDWTEGDSTAVTYIKNKPVLSTVATSGSYNDLTDKPYIPVVPTLATVATTGDYDDLTNKPSIYGDGVVTLTFSFDDNSTATYDVVVNNVNNNQ